MKSIRKQPGLPPHKGLVNIGDIYMAIPKPNKIYPSPGSGSDSVKTDHISIDTTDEPSTEESKPLVQSRSPKSSGEHAALDIIEPIVGGEVQDESPSKIDMGDHTVEELDWSDYS